jgi:HEAT repeat protein
MMKPQDDAVPNGSSLAEKLRAGPSHVRQAALAELITHPDVAAHGLVVERLDDDDPEVCHLAAIVLGLMGTAAVNSLTSALATSPHTPVRVAAASGLARLGPDASVATTELDACLEDADESLRWHAAFALAKIGEPALPVLRGSLDSNNAVRRLAALDAVRWIGQPAEELAPAVRTMSDDLDARDQLLCDSALVRITEDPEQGLPRLTSALESDDDDLRRTAAEQIGQLGELGHDAATSLAQALLDSAWRVRCAAALALARVGANDNATIEVLANTLADSHEDVRCHAAIALASFSAPASSALSALREAEHDADDRVAATAKAAIESITAEP